MTKDELLELADRCEREEAGAHLDQAIWFAIRHPGEPDYAWDVFTTSLDAAVSLIPDGAEWDLTTLHGVARVAVGLNMDVGPHYASHEGGLLPMAICAAALRARASLTEG